jgi:CHAD domain-containing protein
MVEREAKLRAGGDFELPRLGGDERLIDRSLCATYLDTADRRLLAHGVTFRHRIEDGTGHWQLKLPHAEGRLELGWPAGEELVPPDEARALLRGLAAGRELQPVARLDTARRGVHVHDAGRELAEVVLDDVTVERAGQETLRFREIEVELVDGDAADLERLVGLLRDAGAEPTDGRSKLAQALGEPLRAQEQAGSDAAAQVMAYLRRQRDALLDHDPGTRLGRDPDDLHDMRVAVRRLRSALRLSKQAFGDERVRPLRDELRWLGGALGAVRDLDVFAAQLAASIDELAPDDRRDGQLLLATLGRDHRDARAALLEALDSHRYVTLLAAVDALVDGPPPAFRRRDLRRLVRRELRRFRRAVDSLPAEPSDAELHAVRIAAKHARYAAELATETIGKPARRIVRRARLVQDVLGDHQDAHVAEGVLDDLARRTGNLRAAFVAGRLAALQPQRRDAARRAAPGLLRRLSRAWR